MEPFFRWIPPMSNNALTKEEEGWFDDLPTHLEELTEEMVAVAELLETGTGMPMPIATPSEQRKMKASKFL